MVFTSRASTPHKRKGTMLICAAICLTVLVGFASFGIDLGRVQVAKTELRRAADAAARYGVKGIADQTAVAKAIGIFFATITTFSLLAG